MTNAAFTTGVVNGRFQPLHHGHMEYILEASKKCERLIIGITNADAGGFAVSEANPHRSTDEANPFSYFERMEMIKAALLDMGLTHSKFEIVPFPINAPEFINAYVPLDAKVFFTIYDGWGEQKVERVRDQGYQTEVLWIREPTDKITSGAEIRNKIAANKTWAHLVPKPVHDYILENELDKKIGMAGAR